MYHQRFKTTEERFHEKYEKKPSGCWEWKSGKRHPDFRVGKRTTKASRWVVEWALGRELRPEEHVCHHCDNPLCVNPKHLFVGSHLDNMRDKAAKGRSHRPAGIRNPKAKINPEIAAEIRHAYASGAGSQQAIADRYGLGQTTVSQIVRGGIWA